VERGIAEAFSIRRPEEAVGLAGALIYGIESASDFRGTLGLDAT
jgi:hypothetical protein